MGLDKTTRRSPSSFSGFLNSMISIMFYFISKFKIAYAIICPNIIFVMDKLIIFKWSAKFLRYFIAMFGNITVFSRVRMVRFVKMKISFNYSSAFIPRMIFIMTNHSLQITVRTKKFLGFFNLARPAINKFFTNTTFNLWHRVIMRHINNIVKGDLCSESNLQEKTLTLAR